MSKPPQFTAQQFIDAIPDSDGIVSVIAVKVGCSWLTARRYIDNYPTIKAAFDAERESLLDIAESVLANNIKLALQQQSGRVTADSTDAKWLLSRMGKTRGYGDKLEVDLLVEKELEKALDTLEKELSPDTYSAVIRALAGKDS